MSESYTCPHCGAVSYNPNDLRYGYCGRCHRWRDEFAEWSAFLGYRVTDAGAHRTAEAARKRDPARETLMRDPDLKGLARAWKLDASRQQENHRREWGFDHSSLNTYIVHGPFHPFWSWWYLNVVHLRPIPNAPPAKLHYEGAEYELACYSLDPEPKDRPALPDIDGIEQGGDPKKTLPGFLSPPDFVVQFHLRTDLPLDVRDRQAAQILDRVVEHIAAGQSCDSDHRRWWENSIRETAAQYREGKHS